MEQRRSSTLFLHAMSPGENAASARARMGPLDALVPLVSSAGSSERLYNIAVHKRSEQGRNGGRRNFARLSRGTAESRLPTRSDLGGNLSPPPTLMPATDVAWCERIVPSTAAIGRLVVAARELGNDDAVTWRTRSRPGGVRFLFQDLISCGLHPPPGRFPRRRASSTFKTPCAGLSGAIVLDPSMEESVVGSRLTDQSELASDPRVGRRNPGRTPTSELMRADEAHQAWDTPSPRTRGDAAMPYELATATCRFLGQKGSNFELPLSPGERIWILASRVLLDDKWMLGKSSATGMIGLFPSACVELGGALTAAQRRGAKASAQRAPARRAPSVGDQAIAVAAEMLNDERVSWKEFVHLLSITKRRTLVRTGRVHHL